MRRRREAEECFDMEVFRENAELFASILEMSGSGLLDAFYCYGSFMVRTDGRPLHAQMIFTNDMERYLGKRRFCASLVLRRNAFAVCWRFSRFF